MFAAFRSLCGASCVIATGLLATPRVAERTDAVLPGPSTSRIAFASHRDANWEIYLADADGAHQTRLTRRDPQDRFPLWSPDRSRIAFGSQVGGDHWELWVMNVDGSNPRQLAARIVPKGHRQWSHDGTRIVFAANVEGDAEIFSVSRVVTMTSRRRGCFVARQPLNGRQSLLIGRGARPRHYRGATAPRLDKGQHEA